MSMGIGQKVTFSAHILMKELCTKKVNVLIHRFTNAVLQKQLSLFALYSFFSLWNSLIIKYNMANGGGDTVIHKNNELMNMHTQATHITYTWYLYEDTPAMMYTFISIYLLSQGGSFWKWWGMLEGNSEIYIHSCVCASVCTCAIFLLISHPSFNIIIVAQHQWTPKLPLLN